MGAAQMKLAKEALHMRGDELQCSIVENALTSDTSSTNESQVMNQINMAVSLVSFARGGNITVADFAKIKSEPVSLKEIHDDENALHPGPSTQPDIVVRQQVKVEYSGIQDESVVDNNTIDITEEGSLELNSIAKLTNIETKRELLESHGVADFNTVKLDDGATQNTFHPITIDSDSESPDDTDYTMKIEVADDFQIKENLEKENIVPISVDETITNITPQVTERPKLVKNPFSYLCKDRNYSIAKHLPVENIKQENNFVNNFTSEPIIIDSDSENADGPESLVPSATTTENPIIFKSEAGHPLISLKELNVKSENLNSSEDNQEIYKSTLSNYDCLSPSLNSSLNVNASPCDTDSEEIFNKQNLWDIKSTISLNSDAESFKYFSTNEVSSIKNENSSSGNSQPSKNITTPKKRKRIRKGLKLKNLQKQGKLQKQSKVISKTTRRKRKSKKILSKKCSTTDGVYKVCFSKKILFENLPKSNMKTRKKSYKTNVKKVITCTREDFPKPFKFDPSTSANESSASVELPKPMMFKSELAINEKNKKYYLKPEFQPRIRLKRLKPEELLVPLKTKYMRKTRKFESSTNKHKHSGYPHIGRDHKHNFVINRAYSLNTCSKCNHFGTDHDNTYSNTQTPLNNRQMPSYNMFNNTPNECSNEIESKYFTAQELFSLFHSSTPDSTSIYSGGPLDSGASTSTPSLSLRAREQHKTLLLQIAAERAFINNHLMHFGYSPLQFDLFNNPNDLNTVLKYLLGNNA